jgi:hypothetical protein
MKLKIRSENFVGGLEPEFRDFIKSLNGVIVDVEEVREGYYRVLDSDVAKKIVKMKRKLCLLPQFRKLPEFNDPTMSIWFFDEGVNT